jgi:hypothetical protein
MTSYDRSDKTAARCDRAGWPIDPEIIVGCLAQGRAPFATMTAPDAGSGTGEYAKLLPHLGRIEALDRAEVLRRASGAALSATCGHPTGGPATGWLRRKDRSRHRMNG